jgi:hypothetical protein
MEAHIVNKLARIAAKFFCMNGTLKLYLFTVVAIINSAVYHKMFNTLEMTINIYTFVSGIFL